MKCYYITSLTILLLSSVVPHIDNENHDDYGGFNARAISIIVDGFTARVKAGHT
jgi:hypothetical protein